MLINLLSSNALCMPLCPTLQHKFFTNPQYRPIHNEDRKHDATNKKKLFSMSLHHRDMIRQKYSLSIKLGGADGVVARQLKNPL